MEPEELRRRLITELSRSAGPRGFTFMGRTAQPGESADEILARIPTGELEAGSVAVQAPELLKAAIPTVMWKAMSPEAKTVLTKLANKYPILFEKTLKEKRFLATEIEQLMDKGIAGKVQSVSPMTKKLSVDPMFVRDEDVPLHELTHFIQNRRVAKTNPDEAEQIGSLIQEVMFNNMKYPPHMGSFYTAVNDLENMRRLGGIKFTKIPVEDTIHSISPYKYDQTTLIANRQRLMMDEALAYLAQAASQKDSPSIIKLLAARLGVLPE